MVYIYEKLLYFSSVSIGEYNKIASFIRDPLILIAALGTRGIKPTKWQIGSFIIAGAIFSIILGYVLIKLQVPQTNNTISNQYNPQIQQLLYEAQQRQQSNH
jgi:hypothetical protein